MITTRPERQSWTRLCSKSEKCGSNLPPRRVEAPTLVTERAPAPLSGALVSLLTTSALGHKRTRIWAAAMSASRQQADVLNSLLGAMSSALSLSAPVPARRTRTSIGRSSSLPPRSA